MSAQWRRVAVAPGHQLRVRRSPEPASRTGFVKVTQSRRGSIEIREQLWNEGTPA